MELPEDKKLAVQELIEVCIKHKINIRAGVRHDMEVVEIVFEDFDYLETNMVLGRSSFASELGLASALLVSRLVW